MILLDDSEAVTRTTVLRRTGTVKIQLDLSHWDYTNETDLDFLFALAYRALELESEACASHAGREQVGHLLDRLEKLDFRKK